MGSNVEVYSIEERFYSWAIFLCFAGCSKRKGVYDTYTGKELGAMKLARVEKQEGYFVSMDNNQSVRLNYNASKPALSDLHLVITKKTEDGGGLSDNGQKLKDLIDYAIKDNIPADGYYSLAFKGRVVVAQCSELTNSEIYDYGKMGIFSDLISNYKPEA